MKNQLGNWKNLGTEKMSRRQFNKYLWISFYSAFSTIIFGPKAEAQTQISFETAFSPENQQIIRRLIEIYKEFGKLRRIDIVRSVSENKLVFSLDGRPDNLKLQSDYEKTELEKLKKEFDKLKRQLEQDLFEKMENTAGFRTSVDGISLEFSNLKGS